jgi:hypothetical protein
LLPSSLLSASFADSLTYENLVYLPAKTGCLERFKPLRGHWYLAHKYCNHSKQALTGINSDKQFVLHNLFS